MKIGVQSIEDGEWLNNPRPITVDIAALNIVKGLEHIDVPLTKFVNPRWQELRATCELDDMIKPLLENRWRKMCQNPCQL
jgi:hypothetical protein